MPVRCPIEIVRLVRLCYAGGPSDCETPGSGLSRVTRSQDSFVTGVEEIEETRATDEAEWAAAGKTGLARVLLGCSGSLPVAGIEYAS